MTIALVLLYGLVAWRVSSLLLREDGPFRIFDRVRDLVGANRSGELSALAGLFTCIWCISVWVGAALTLTHGIFVGWDWWLWLLPFGISTLVLLLERIMTESRTFPL